MFSALCKWSVFQSSTVSRRASLHQHDFRKNYVNELDLAKSKTSTARQAAFFCSKFSCLLPVSLEWSLRHLMAFNAGRKPQKITSRTGSLLWAIVCLVAFHSQMRPIWKRGKIINEISFLKISINLSHQLLCSFQLNGHTKGFYTRSQTLKP